MNNKLDKIIVSGIILSVFIGISTYSTGMINGKDASENKTNNRQINNDPAYNEKSQNNGNENLAKSLDKKIESDKNNKSKAQPFKTSASSPKNNKGGNLYKTSTLPSGNYGINKNNSTGLSTNGGNSNFIPNNSHLKSATNGQRPAIPQKLKDGVYYGQAKGFDGLVKVKVGVSGGKIKSVDVVSHSETPGYYEKGARVIPSIISSQSTSIDSISGATYTSNAIKNAVADALKNAGQGSSRSSYASLIKDAEDKIRTAYDNEPIRRGDAQVIEEKENHGKVDGGEKNKESKNKEKEKNPGVSKEKDSPKENKVGQKYANGIFTGKGYGFYSKGQGRQPIMVDVEFKNNKIVKIVLHDDKEGYKFPDDKTYGRGAYARVSKFLMKRLENSDDYIRDLENVEKDLKFIFGRTSPDTYEKRKEYDTITGATGTSTGITQATLDAITQAKNSHNSKLIIKSIKIENKMDKYLYIGDTIYLKDLMVKVEYNDGKVEHVKYKDFDERGLIASIDVNGKRIYPKKDEVNIEIPNETYAISVYDKKSKYTIDSIEIISKAKIFVKNDLFYRIGNKGNFIKIDKKMNTIVYYIDIKNKDIGNVIEFKSDTFRERDSDRVYNDPYHYKSSIIPKSKNFITLDDRGKNSPEDSEFIKPNFYESGGFKIEFRVLDKSNESTKDKLHRLINENKDSDNVNVKNVIEKMKQVDKGKNYEDARKDLEKRIKEKDDEYKKYEEEFKTLSARLSEGGEIKDKALANIKNRCRIEEEKEELKKELYDMNREVYSEDDLLAFIREIENALSNEENDVSKESISESRKKLQKEVAVLEEKIGHLKKDDESSRLRELAKRKIDKAKSILKEEDTPILIHDINHVLTEFEGLEKKIDAKKD